jgi:hypothetical protein
MSGTCQRTSVNPLDFTVIQGEVENRALIQKPTALRVALQLQEWMPSCHQREDINRICTHASGTCRCTLRSGDAANGGLVPSLQARPRSLVIGFRAFLAKSDSLRLS